MAKISRREFKKGIASLSEAFRQRIEAEVDGFDAEPLSIHARKNRAMDDFEFFCKNYFPHYVKKSNSVLHEYLYKRLPEIANSDKSETDAIAAPRGEAKSTITSQLFVLWCAVTGRKKYPMIGMDAFDQAAIMLEAIKAELEYNPRLKMDFPEAMGQGRVWQAGVIVTANGVKIEVVGSGKRIRGRRHGPYRPDLFIGDDLENDENVNTPEQRDKLQSWITKAVLKLGGAGDKFDVIVVGTILHYDSVLNRLLKNSLWKSAKFKALIQWPENMDLWDRWEELLLNVSESAGDDFYKENKSAMDQGAIVSWPTGRPLIALMKIRARDGHAAFDSELQNDPLSNNDATFANCITFWVNRLNEWVFYGTCDPSLGKAGHSRDPSAILVGGFNRNTGILDVVEAVIKKRLPDRIIEDIISFEQEYKCRAWGIETVQFQEFLFTELIKRSAIRGVPVAAVAIKSHSDKILRIESIQPHIKNGLIRLHNSQHTLIEQLRHFPKADHDDGPDALQMLWELVVSGIRPIEYESSGSQRLLAKIGGALKLTERGFGSVASGRNWVGY